MGTKILTYLFIYIFAFWVMPGYEDSWLCTQGTLAGLGNVCSWGMDAEIEFITCKESLITPVLYFWPQHRYSHVHICICVFFSIQMPRISFLSICWLLKTLSLTVPTPYSQSFSGFFELFIYFFKSTLACIHSIKRLVSVP